jgi:putative transposase
MRLHRTVLSQRLHAFLGEEEILAAAGRAGFGERVRKCPPLLFFWTLVLGVNGQAKRSLSSLRRFFMSITGCTITSAAFQKRFSDPAAQMFKALFERLLEKSLSDRRRPLPPKLRRFREILAVDSTAFSLHDKLAKHFRGYKSMGTRAMARISVQFGLSDHRLRRADVSSARLGEGRFFKITRGLRNHLLIFDLGYFKIARFRALQRVGAHFVSRLQEGVNPLILAVHAGHRRGRSIVGKKLRSVSLSGPWIDLDVRVGTGSNSVEVRLVGAFNEQEQRYHFYLTTLPRKTFGPGDVSEIYRLRWQVELLFRELKSVCRLTHIPTGKKAGALCLMYAALIVHLLSRFLGWLLMKKRPWDFSPETWTLFLFNYAWAMARAIVHRQRHRLEGLLRELRSAAPVECMRASRGRGGVYGAIIG